MSEYFLATTLIIIVIAVVRGTLIVINFNIILRSRTAIRANELYVIYQRH